MKGIPCMGRDGAWNAALVPGLAYPSPKVSLNGRNASCRFAPLAELNTTQRRQVLDWLDRARPELAGEWRCRYPDRRRANRAT